VHDPLREATRGRTATGEFEFGSDLLVGHVPRGQVVEKWVELEVAEGRSQLGAFLEVVQNIRFGGQGTKALREDVDRQVDQLGLAGHRAERFIEEFEILRHLLVSHLHVSDADRYLGGDTRRDEALPEDALLLDMLEALVDIADMHARAHILPGKLLESATIGRRHLW
jgi:hypothetical protein